MNLGVGPAGDHESLFDAPGHMAGRMRELDWSRTPLGPVERWPQSLRTTVSLCLASRFPILLWWGPELVNIYNDGMALILGGKHPRGLGLPGRDVWPEIWDLVGPMLDGVVSRGEATWSEDQLLLLDRNGFPEECYFTFAYSPIRDESGGVGGVFTPGFETTDRVIGERRLALYGRLAAISGEANSAETACQLAAVALTGDQEDMPFALVYLLDQEGGSARLAAATTAMDGPGVLELPAGCVLREALSSATPRRLADIAEVTERSLPRDPRPALVVPIQKPGQSAAYGFMVAGFSARLAIDDVYLAFFSLVANHIGEAIAAARAHEEELRRAEALAELDRAKTEFFGNVSHELRTPLTLQLAPLQDLLASADDESLGAHRDQLELIHRNSLRLLKLVNALLDFARLQAGRIEASFEPLDLSQLTTDLASGFRSAIERAGLRLEVDCPPLAEPVYVDRDMWEKIVLNLLSNALKFTFEGTISVRLRAEEGQARLQVTDTGTGIPAAELPHLFDRFHRVRGARARTHEGTGIGLALVQELARLHGGQVRVESVFGRGTTLTVEVPLGTAHLPSERISVQRELESTHTGVAPFVEEALRWLPDVPPAPSAAANALPTAGVAQTSGDRVLVVDDNADMRTYIAGLLGQLWQVQVASDGASALELAREIPPSLVLADVMMPGLDGFQLLRALRADERTQDIPVILLSARAGPEATVEGLESGADDYLIKPFSARELVARVHGHLELARVRREARLQDQQRRAQSEAERARFEAIFRQAPAMVAVVRGPDHVFEMANARYVQAVGGRRLVGLRVRDALPELAGQRSLELLDQVYRRGEAVVGDETQVRLDLSGTGVLSDEFFDFVYQPLRNSDGVVDGILIHAVRVTDKVVAAAHVRNLAARLETLLQHLPVGVLLAEAPDAVVVLDNAAARTIWQRTTLVGISLAQRDLPGFHPDGRPYLAQEWPVWRSVTNGEVISGEEIEFGRPDGSRVVVNVSSAPVRDASGTILAAVGVYDDITELKSLARQRDEFLAAAAHDLRTPLATIQGTAQLMERQLRQLEGAPPSFTRSLAAIGQSTRRIAALVEELQESMRIEAGRLDLVLRQTDLVDLARAAIAELGTVETHRVELVADVQALSGRWDAARLLRVISNLVGNAVKYSPDGGSIQVRVFAEDHNQRPWAALSVTDNGLGIREQDLQRIFERFYRATNVSDTILGSGIGLAYVKDIVERHGGTVDVHSTEGAGSTFTIRLPLEPAS